jgi:hypothetical protein
VSNWFIKFFPRDCWMGMYIGEREPCADGYYRTIYICTLPMIVFGFDLRMPS